MDDGSAMAVDQPETQSDPLYGRLENFRVEKRIGKGQFSVVFKAKNLINQRWVLAPK